MNCCHKDTTKEEQCLLVLLCFCRNVVWLEEKRTMQFNCKTVIIERNSASS